MMRLFAKPDEITSHRVLAKQCVIWALAIAVCVTVLARITFDLVFPQFGLDVRIVTSLFAFVMAFIVLVPLLWAFGDLNVRLMDANEKLETMANMDPLTGLMNRRALVDRFDVLTKKADARLDQVGLMILDADHFKSINDTHGHDGGDAALIHLSDVLRTFDDKHTIIARLGGEEFAVCRFGRNIDSGLAQAICRSVAESAFDHNGQRVPLTVSVGYRQFHPGANLSDMMRDADNAVYRAKASGRNRIAVSLTDAPPLAATAQEQLQLGERKRPKKSGVNA